MISYVQQFTIGIGQTQIAVVSYGQSMYTPGLIPLTRSIDLNSVTASINNLVQNTNNASTGTVFDLSG